MTRPAGEVYVPPAVPVCVTVAVPVAQYGEPVSNRCRWQCSDSYRSSCCITTCTVGEAVCNSISSRSTCYQINITCCCIDDNSCWCSICSTCCSCLCNSCCSGCTVWRTSVSNRCRWQCRNSYRSSCCITTCTTGEAVCDGISTRSTCYQIDITCCCIDDNTCW